MTGFDANALGAISHVLLDIEGTTCPVSFVSETLFPYAAAHLESFLQENAAEETVSRMVRDVQSSWLQDSDPEAQTLLSACANNKTGVVPYLQWLIRRDRKLTALKDLQGLIWEKGYQMGKLQGPLFADVAPALQRWINDGLTLAVYSSGSIQAQQLIYAHSNAGDLSAMFKHWFDTKTGPKLDACSYQRIADAMGADGKQILFISDASGELEAARRAGLQVVHCNRDDEGSAHNATDSPGKIASIRSFDELTTLPISIDAAPNR